MMTKSAFPKLVFDIPFDERIQYDVKLKGWFGCVKVLMQDGKSYSVVFYDIARLTQGLEDEMSSGNKFIADAGMIVLPEVTLENMTIAVQKLASEGYFSRFNPL